MKPPFISPVKVILEKEIIARAQHFAREVTPTVDYTDSNQVSESKINNDHYISKLGEEAVRNVFLSRGAIVIGPDYGIHFNREKSWSADLIINGIEVAVKAQKKSSARRYGLSWTFQSSGKRKDPILQHPEAWVCFVECDDHSHVCHCRVFPPLQIRKLPFEEPRLNHLSGSKKVVYLDTMIRKGLAKSSWRT